MSSKYKIGILGATGMVGQTFISLLQNHPIFQIVALGASSKSSGKMYKDVVKWHLTNNIQDVIGEMIVQDCYPLNFEECDIIFSALDSSVADEIEMEFVMSDFPVFSNAKNYRMHDLVPLVVPLVNPENMNLINSQRKEWNVKSGFLLTNANCSTTGLSVVIKALENFGPLKRVLVTTMQAISGAGYPGVSSLDILSNVIPHIDGEEEKIEKELIKILGYNKTSKDVSKRFPLVSASCNRVPIINGHLESVFVEFDTDESDNNFDSVKFVDKIIKTLENYNVQLNNKFNSMGSIDRLYSLPEKSIVVTDKLDRPQPKYDSTINNGMSVVVGKIKKCNAFRYGVKLTLLVNNTILGAAGSAILNAEISICKGFINK